MKTLHCKLALWLFLLLLLTTCFSPLDYKGSGDTTLRVSLPGGTAGARTAVTPEDLRYELHFSGPGGRTVTATAVYGETVTVNVVPGTWTVSVWAYDSAGTPKAVGEAYNIDVKAGKENNVPMKMAVYTEVSTWAALKNAIDEGGDYDEYVVVTGPITANSTTTTVASPSNPGRTITLSSKGGPHTVELTVNGSLFTVSANTELILKNITLQGRTGNNASLVMVNTNGKLVLHSGGKITGNTTTGNGGGVYVSGNFTMTSGEISVNNANGTGADAGGGGVYVTAGGTFNMSGGDISGNTTPFPTAGGGGVLVIDNGTFTMSGGAISGNTSDGGGGVCINGSSAIFNMSGSAVIGGTTSGSTNTANVSGGGGVFINGGSTFIMNGGEISGNSAITGTYIGGGGVCVNAGTFTMYDGSITGNTADSDGGGVIIGASSTFTMNGGTIGPNNKANDGGGGVMIDGIFTMRGSAIIHGNTSDIAGGGVHIHYGKFTMEGNARISGNTTVSSNGGGVYVSNYGNFYMVAGTVYGSANSAPKPPSGYENTAPSIGNGPAMYTSIGTAQRGTFTGSGGSWVSKGNLSTTDTTIRMVNGEFQ